MKLQNYRLTFGGDKIDYKNDFKSCRLYHPIIKEITSWLKVFKASEVWWFFEPYVEITWIGGHGTWENTKSILVATLEKHHISEYNFKTPEDGEFADWYCNNKQEQEFGYKSYSKSAELADLFYEYKEDIQNGRGLENQYVRRCHVLANQLAMNYKEEGIALIKRGILCLLFWWFGHNKAVWVYTKILRQKY